MVSLVETIAKSLVSDPEKVEVTETTSEDGKIVVQLKVAQEDMSKIIGRQGRIAKALRTVVKAAAVREGLSVVVEIVS
ncbi:MAG: KH domain-containing protein [Firmicutes bacterium]|nr:KH domain-containing protein [Bacillota bacterium]